MSSVVAAWHGALRERAAQDELLSYIARVAELNGEYLAREMRVPRYSKIVAAQRMQEAAVEDSTDDKIIDAALTGRIVIRSDVHGPPDGFVAAARDAGLTPQHSDGAREYPVISVDTVHLRGRDFRLLDPRRLYPGTDRLSFVFMACPKAPFLDGSLCTVTPKARLQRATSDVARGADWYLECPYIHLRYVLEDWTFQLLSWVKFFFMSGLTWNGYEELQGYETEAATYRAFADRDGVENAKRHSFYVLMEAFRADAESWIGTFAKLRDDEDE
jgi:hypothetical protein